MAEAFKFTHARIAQLPRPAPGVRATYKDTEVRGLQLRAAASGVKTFSALVRPRNRRPVRHTIGRFPEVSVDAARREARSFIAEMQTTGDLERVRAKKRGLQTLGWLFDAFFERHSRPNKRTWREDQANWDRYLEKPLGRLPLTEINRERISLLHSRITASHGPVAANRTIALLSSMFGWAADAGLWAKNPAQGIRRNPERSRSRFLSDAEMARLQAVLDQECPPDVRDLIRLALYTGARRGTLLSMRWEDIDLDRGEWHIERTKNGFPLVLPLVGPALDVLRHRRGDSVSDSPFVFPGEGKSGHMVDPKRAVTTALKKAGLKGVRFHDLRRTMATWLVKENVSLGLVGRALGHRDLRSTSVYAHADTRAMREALEIAATAMTTAKPEAASNVVKLDDARTRKRILTQSS